MYVKLAAVSALLATAANGYYLPLAQTGTALPFSQQQPLIQAPEQETATTTTRPYVLNEEAAAAYWAERIKNGFPFDQVTTPPSPLDENTIADINQAGNENLSTGMDTTGERASPYGSQSFTTPTTTAASTTTASSTVASTTTAATTTAATTTAATTTAATTTAATTTAAPRAGYATPKKENRSGSTMDVTGGASPYGAPKTTPKVATTSAVPTSTVASTTAASTTTASTTTASTTTAAPTTAAPRAGYATPKKENRSGSTMDVTGGASPYGAPKTTPKVATTSAVPTSTVAAPQQKRNELGSGMNTTVGRTSPYGSQSTTTAPKTTTVATTTASSTATMASTTVAAPQAGYDIPQDQNELGSGMDSTTESAAPLYETTMSSGSQLGEDDLLTGSGSGMYAAVGPNSAYVSSTRTPNVATTSTVPTSTIATTQASYGVPQEYNEFGSGMDVTDGRAAPLYETAQFGDDDLLTDGNGSGMYIAIGPNSLYELPY